MNVNQHEGLGADRHAKALTSLISVGSFRLADSQCVLLGLE